MRPEDYKEEDVHALFDDALKREQHPRTNPVTIGTIIKLAKDGGYASAVAASTPRGIDFQEALSFDLDAAVPVWHATGMVPREFAGPKLGKAHLFPVNAYSLLVALGGVGKTTAIVGLGTHIAAGRLWGSEAPRRRKVIIFSVEESKEELDRKFGAAVCDWSDGERDAAIENLRIISLVGTDPRLTHAEGRSIIGTTIAPQIIAAAQKFGAEVIFLDHLQGFADGDLNSSDTATALAREANVIAHSTGAAVVIAAHTNKTKIGAQEVDNGFTTGSLAFENAARQVVGIIPLPDADAKTLGLEAVRRDFMLMAMPKNSYGPSGEKAYLRKVYVPDFHTVKVEPLYPLGRMAVPSASERLKQALGDFIKANPGQCSKNAIEKQAGKKGPFRASKAEVRAALGQLVGEGVLSVRPITKEERNAHGYPHQTKEVYEHV